MIFGLEVIKKGLNSLKRQINRYYITKLQRYRGEKDLTISNYLKILQVNPTLVTCAILLTTKFVLIPILLFILLILIQELTIIFLVLTFRYNFNYLTNCQWSQMSEVIHNCLQLIKYSRMVQLGYELRANTNIMLHDEIQYSLFQSQECNQRQFKLQTEIIAVYKKLLGLFSSLDAQFYTKNKSLKQISKLSYPLNFRTIFQLNHNLGIILNYLQSTGKKYTFFVSNELNQFINIIKLTFFIRFSFRKSLKEISENLKVIEQEMQNQLRSSQNSKLFHSLKKQQEYQELQSIFNHFTSISQIKAQQRAHRIDQIIEINGYQQKEIKKETTQVDEKKHQNLQQRKHFMAQLDRLLIIGLARKKQQDFQQKLRMQQFNQDQPLIKQHIQ